MYKRGGVSSGKIELFGVSPVEPCPARLVMSLKERERMCHVLIIEDEVLLALELQDLVRDHGAKSFSIAATECTAIAAARIQKPDFIV